MIPENVKQKDLGRYLVWLIEEFHRFNVQPYFDALDEDVLWFGGMDGHMARTKPKVIEAFVAPHYAVERRIGPVYVASVPHGARQCDTVATFVCNVVYPDGSASAMPMLYHVSWVKKERWLISVVSVTGRPGAKPGSENALNPYSWADGPQNEKRVLLNEKGSENTLCILPSEISLAEGSGHYCTVHFNGKTMTVRESVRSLTERCGGALVRCHSGYAVNPLFVQAVTRFTVTLNDGTQVPVPEKRYTEVKRELLAVRRKNGLPETP